MAGKGLSMRKVREILRLRFGVGCRSIRSPVRARSRPARCWSMSSGPRRPGCAWLTDESLATPVGDPLGCVQDDEAEPCFSTR
jgi:hypothetical protein